MGLWYAKHVRSHVWRNKYENENFENDAYF